MSSTGRIGVHAISALLPDLTDHPGPRYRALSSALTALLLDGRLSPGLRLPSERDLAAALRISRATATAAYDELARERLLTRRRGSGSYLNLPAGARLTGPGSRVQRDGAGHEVLDLSIACLAPVPGDIEAALAAVAPRLARYTAGDGYQPYGLAELRDAVAERYRSRGLATRPEQILITNGAQHAFDLVLRLAVNPGDRVLTELPTYPGSLECIRASGGRAVAVPFASGGQWDTDAIGNLLSQTAPRFAFLIPDFHNPTGVLIGADERRQVTAAAHRSGTRIVVDESFVDLDLRAAEYRTDPPPMAALDEATISVGSLSKPVWGGLRIGWIRTDAETVQRLTAVRARSDMSGAVIEQLLAVELLSGLDRTAELRRHELRAGLRGLLDALAIQLPGWAATVPDGGLSLWVRLDAPAATRLANRLETRGVLITPGSRFAPDSSLESYLRIPFALPAADLARAVTVMAQTWNELGSGRAATTRSELVSS
jgi:DNA-binding transcriptional MocR family regulator